MRANFLWNGNFSSEGEVVDFLVWIIPLEYKYVGEDYQMNTRKIDPS